MENSLPVGKLPPSLLAELLKLAPGNDERIIQGPGLGLDCAVIDIGPQLLVLKSDPITFATDSIGEYLVQVNANDLATTGATPLWLLVTLLLPETKTTSDSVRTIVNQIYDACQAMKISVVGGHTEITYGLDRPIVLGTMLGLVPKDRLIIPTNSKSGDIIILAKGIPIEATALLAREFPEKLLPSLSEAELLAAQNFLVDPGISVLEVASIALEIGGVTAMHDPTEGGVKTALWEMAEACVLTMEVDIDQIQILPLADRICHIFGIDPLASLSSGALLLAVKPGFAKEICMRLNQMQIPCSKIGYLKEGHPVVFAVDKGGRVLLPRPERDEIARIFSN